MRAETSGVDAPGSDASIMKCPYCGFVESRVTDSRDQGGTIHRRRRCERCFQRFSTVERVVLPELMVVKQDGRREAFNREKLHKGLRLACQKRPIPVGELEALVEDVENEVYKLGRAEVETRVIGELVMERLRKLERHGCTACHGCQGRVARGKGKGQRNYRQGPESPLAWARG